MELKSENNQCDDNIKIPESLQESSKSSMELNSNNKRQSNLLTANEISKYSRQLILPEIGVAGQLRLKKSSVLIVGAGGLGCPVATYLAAAGIGHIGIVDHDVVDISNLHRQVAHKSTSIGQQKSLSLINSLKELNPDTKYSMHAMLLNSSNVEDVIKPYSIIVDASDNVPTRYLLNDAAVLYKKPLVSGSALRFEGQLTVYNYKDGPCYRCLFPKPPLAEAVTNCSDGGVLGAITGTIGCMQSLEVIKIAVGMEPSYYKKMLLFDGFNGDVRIIKLRGKVEDCAVCGKKPSITKLIDYELFCNTPAADSNIRITLLSDEDRISCKEYKDILDSGRKHILVDVRSSAEVDICRLPNSLNVPMNQLQRESTVEKLSGLLKSCGSTDNFVVCRRGNDSQKAVLELRKLVSGSAWRDIKGGLHAWHDEIDADFPKY